MQSYNMEQGFGKILALFVAIGLAQAIPEYASTIRPPAFPLAVRNPYTNVWLGRNQLPGEWPMFWTTKTMGWTGMVKVDDATYIWMGRPAEAGETLAPFATQTAAITTPTQTHFLIKAGPLDLNVTFFSPVEIDDIPRQSIPLSYVWVDVVSNDGAAHNVQMYMDISGEWATGDNAQAINWTLSSTPAGLKVWSTQLQNQIRFGEHNDYAAWGSAVLVAAEESTTMSGSDLEVRNAFISSSSLPNTDDTDYRCASCDWPTFGVAQDLGSVSSVPKRVNYVVGNIREENVNWLGIPQFALWVDNWPTREELFDFFWADLEDSLVRADSLDERILNDAFQAGGQRYADILTFSLRQSYAGNEFSGGKGSGAPIYYQKEISSGGFMQTVDVIYPAAPLFIYTNITYLELLLEPLFYQMEEGVWTRPFAMHDIGARFPNATGQGYGGDMPVEESANMIMMVGDIVFHPSADMARAKAYVESHYDMMHTWAEYLLENSLYPVDQLTTDDFIGHTELNSGLALKGILGMATFAKLSGFIGNTTEEERFNQKVAEYVPIWYNESLHGDGDHLKMEYNRTDGYQFKYNALHDQLLDLNVVPENVYQMEAQYYLGLLEPYGIPFVSIHDYTKSDWEMWTAAAFGDASPELRNSLVDTLGRFLTVTPQRIPFTDWYVTATSNHVGFQARPVAGGHFALLAKDIMKRKM